MTTEITGWRSTRSTTHPHPPPRARRRSRLSPGGRPLSMRSPSFESTAGSTLIEPSIATATTRIVPVPKEAKVTLPVMYRPAMATITVKPDTSTARPLVAAATSSAVRSERPAARSSRSRRM